ncbi:sigma-70 family RNA polymerase sigma factor [Staphylococcus massiliensis]|uniref:sigma-70 family RNA polymerase sigma factor n=1 Tax=Staphylococcus massiliensis TaxID=555791 RepID=UPI001EDF9D0D|nr:sigma-70 family RNA polymerase sigma factor [Staphylococcus massiliensis]MCG3412352.1 sigma-70 family RNA polymerase sigma factor [Staphylococcus massiliensis]
MIQQQLSNEELSTLIKNYQSNRDASKEALVKTLRPYILEVLIDYRVNRQDREDICHDIIMKLMQHFEHFVIDDTLPITHYLNKVIKRAKIDYLRAHMRLEALGEMILNESKAAYYAYQAIYYAELEQNMVHKEELAFLECFSERLSPFEVQVVDLLMKEYKPREIALKFRVEEKVVYNAIYRCKHKLKKYYKRLYLFDN